MQRAVLAMKTLDSGDSAFELDRNIMRVSKVLPRPGRKVQQARNIRTAMCMCCPNWLKKSALVNISDL